MQIVRDNGDRRGSGAWSDYECESFSRVSQSGGRQPEKELHP